LIIGEIISNLPDQTEDIRRTNESILCARFAFLSSDI